VTPMEPLIPGWRCVLATASYVAPEKRRRTRER
jgi:hypothetical protein